MRRFRPRGAVNVVPDTSSLISPNAGSSVFAGKQCSPDFFVTSYENNQVHSVLGEYAQRKGYKCVFVCPDKVSQDKINVLRAYGADVVVCPTAVAPEHPDSYYNVSDRLVREIPDAWKPDQYSNPNNPLSHYHSTGPELWEQTDGRISAFVAGVGTGGTISGTGRYLKEASEGRVKIIGACAAPPA